MSWCKDYMSIRERDEMIIYSLGKFVSSSKRSDYTVHNYSFLFVFYVY